MILLVIGTAAGAYEGFVGFLLFGYQVLVIVAIAYMAKVLADLKQDLSARR